MQYNSWHWHSCMFTLQDKHVAITSGISFNLGCICYLQSSDNKKRNIRQWESLCCVLGYQETPNEVITGSQRWQNRALPAVFVWVVCPLKCPLMKDIRAGLHVGGAQVPTAFLCPPSERKLQICDCAYVHDTYACVSVTGAIFYLFVMAYFTLVFQVEGL